MGVRCQSLQVIVVRLLVLGTPLQARRVAVGAEHRLITSAHVLASEAAVEMLRGGANADAAPGDATSAELIETGEKAGVRITGWEAMFSRNGKSDAQVAEIRYSRLGPREIR